VRINCLILISYFFAPHFFAIDFFTRGDCIMSNAILVINAGSSSVKFSIFLDVDTRLELLVRGQIEGLPDDPHFLAKDAAGKTLEEQRWQTGKTSGHEEALEVLLTWAETTSLRDHRLWAAGHRVVHGGVEFAAPERVDAPMLERLEKLIPLAPLHEPHNIAAMRALARHKPELPQVACFDTAFHRSQPLVAQSFAVPRWLTAEGVRRYGFHGLSYEYIASILPERDPRAASGRTIVAHLGNGASLCALAAGRSVATTMSFTALDGLPMGTRCGSLDPAVLIYLMDRHGMDARALEHLLYHESGLLGVSEIGSDMRTLLDSTDPRAREAIDLFVYRVGREIGSLAAALGGLDALVFTAGIGEHGAAIRARICQGSAWLGVELNEAANAANETRISQPTSRVSAWVLPTNEELVIARHTRRLLEKG
jgi:acetate kinase